MSNQTIVLIYPTHLFERLEPILSKSKTDKYKYYILEEPLFFSSEERIVDYNGLKLLLHRVSMKLYQYYLKDNGLDVSYIDFNDITSFYSTTLTTASKIIYYDTVDHLLEKRIAQIASGKQLIRLENQGFLCSNNDLAKYLESRKAVKRKFFHNDFYRWQRKRLSILMDDNGNYLGGKLSFDSENRQTMPKAGLEYPAYHMTGFHPIISESTDYIKKTFPHYLGNLDEWHHLSFDFKTARQKLRDFLKNRLMNFGDWEDVMDQSNPFVFHSLLSSSLNIGIITPDVVLEETLSHYYGHMDIIGINDIEGFVRQLIGWREYYRMVYKYQYNELVTNNTLNHTNILSSAWYNGTTGIAPLDHSINIAFKYGYLHHILRLMLVGQFMLLSEINPHEMYRWFMEFAIDSYDWVMVPNVYGMVGYNDGGGTTTKPYISSSNYILKMSNYKKDGYWENVWRALYYNFIKNNEKMLQTNPRTRRMVWQANRLSPPELNSMLETAKEFIASIAHTK
jgi:deoxyribodipyrimidine photolyase-related protein